MLLDVCRGYCVKILHTTFRNGDASIQMMTPLDVLARVVAIIGSDTGNSLVNRYSLGALHLDASEFILELFEDNNVCVELIIVKNDQDESELIDYTLTILDGDELKVPGEIVLATNHTLLGTEMLNPTNYNVESM